MHWPAPARRRAAAWLLERKGNPVAADAPTAVAWSGTTRRGWAGPGSRAPTPGSSRRPWSILALDRGRPGIPSPRRRENSCGPKPGHRTWWMELRENDWLRPAASTPAGTDRPGAAGPGGYTRASTARERSIRPSPIYCERSPTSGLRAPKPEECSAFGPGGTPAQPPPRTG